MRRVDREEATQLAVRDLERWRSAHGECGMCAIANGASGPIIAENDHATCVLDRLAARPGHLLVALRRHVERFAELEWNEVASLQRLAWQAARALEATHAPARVYVAMLGASRPNGKSFPHVHTHVVPLADGGPADRPATVFTWDSVVVYDDDEAHALAARLRDAFPRE